MIMSRDGNIVKWKCKNWRFILRRGEKFKYLGATVTNINGTREEIKRRINMGNACHYSVEKLLSSSLLSKNLKVRIYKTVIYYLVVLYGCETWTLTLREEHRLRVFENKVLRKIFGAKRDEVTGEWRKLHNTELHALYSSPDIIRNLKSRRLRWAGHVARMGESRNAYRVLVGRRPLGRPRRRWEDNIKMDLREVGYDDRDWINLAQDRDRWRAYVRATMNLQQLKSHLSLGCECSSLHFEPVDQQLMIHAGQTDDLAKQMREDCVGGLRSKDRVLHQHEQGPHVILVVKTETHLKSGWRKNDAETDQEEKKELVGSLTEKKLPAEGCTGRNGEREKSSGQKKKILDVLARESAKITVPKERSKERATGMAQSVKAFACRSEVALGRRLAELEVDDKTPMQITSIVVEGLRKKHVEESRVVSDIG
ncbi:hypothetical protein ANN_20148 [Periplaneta americana]|uniref:Endonuclease-reverse transcriptase n=1 Tax=Periplaneta americana TaxID=6978 RepID=A0ABQ8SBT7_PERAM|nr:hypothetical protein ANN_20148 [Periplaneta americana]